MSGTRLAADELKIRERMEISTQAKRMLLWEVANECAKCEEVIRSVTLETMPDGTVVKTIHVLSLGL